MKAVISCGGRGSRLGLNFPKSMIMVYERPLVSYQLEVLKEAGIRYIALSTHQKFLHEFIGYEECGLLPSGINYSYYRHPLRHPLCVFRNERLINSIRGEPFIYSYGDVLYPSSLIKRMKKKYLETRCSVGTKVPPFIEPLEFTVNPDGKITGFIYNEKPPFGINAPYLFAPSAQDRVFDVARSDASDILKLNIMLILPGLYVVEPEEFFDVDTPEDLNAVKEYIRRKRL